MKKIFAIIITLFLLTAVLALPVYAYTLDDGAGNVTENGTDPTEKLEVEGDYINLTGGAHNLRGSIGGDLLGFFTSLTVKDAVIGGSMRFVSFETALDDVTCRNLTFAGTDTNIGKNVKANAIYAYTGGTFVFEGSCDTLVVYAQKVVIKGTINDNAEIHSDDVSFASDCTINNVTVNSVSAPYRNDTDGYSDAVGHFDSLTWNKVNVWRDTLVKLPSVIIYALTGALIIQFIFGKHTRRTAEVFKAHPVRFSFSGVLYLISIPGLAAFMFMLSMEIASALLFLYMALISVSQLFAGSVLGARLFPTMNRFLSAVIATTTLAIICALPYVGGVATIASLVIAFGFFSVSVFSRKADKKEPASETNA
ncbi:MAG: hypothetical protein J6V84_04620 [Clostridia bacterium]|nr:hypothetical protein [Clostridia bacterium]